MNGYEVSTMSLDHIQEDAGYVLVVERGDGKVLILGTDNARNRLIAINAASPLEHFVRAFRTPHYAAIVAALKHRYGRWSEDGLGVWFHVDARELVVAVEEFDLATGRRVRAGPWLRVGARTLVKGIGFGHVKSIDALTGGARVLLERPFRDLKEVIASPSMLKPHMRAPAP